MLTINFVKLQIIALVNVGNFFHPRVDCLSDFQTEEVWFLVAVSLTSHCSVNSSHPRHQLCLQTTTAASECNKTTNFFNWLSGMRRSPVLRATSFVCTNFSVNCTPLSGVDRFDTNFRCNFQRLRSYNDKTINFQLL